MAVSLAFLIAAIVVLAAYARRQGGDRIPAAVAFARHEGLRLAVRLPFSFVAATCLAELIPDRAIASVMGPATGFGGIVIASLAGGLMPGGPMVSFPLALVLAQEGAGGAQLVALITGWSVFAFNRVLAYELPMLGWRFTVVRFLSSAFVPLTAGVAAGSLAELLGIALRLG